MAGGILLLDIRFVPLDPDSPRFFGFGEFLAGLARMVVAWTIARVRHRFRLSIYSAALR